MMAEDDPLVRGLKIMTVAKALRGRGALVVQRHHAGCQEFRVKPVADEIRAHSGNHQPHTVYRLSAGPRDGGHGEGGGDCNQRPKKSREEAKHSTKITEARA